MAAPVDTTLSHRTARPLPAAALAASGPSPRGQGAPRPSCQELLPAHEDTPASSSTAGRNPVTPATHGEAATSRMSIWGGRAWGEWKAGADGNTRLGGRRGGGGPPTHGAQPHVPGEGIMAPSSLACGQSHITWGLGHERAAWGPAGEAGWAGQHPLGPGVAWLSLAAVVGAVETKEQVRGPSQPSHQGHLYCGELGLGELFVRGRTEDETPPSSPP